MKNIIVAAILIILLLLTGCSNNKVTCIIESNHNEIGFIAKTEVVGYTKSDNITKYDYKVTMTFDDEEMATSSYNTLITGYEDKEIIFSQKGKVITGTSNVKMDEIVTKLEFIEELEEEGYTCK